MKIIGKYDSRVLIDTTPGQFVLIPTVGILYGKYRWKLTVNFLWLNIGCRIGIIRRRADHERK